MTQNTRLSAFSTAFDPTDTAGLAANRAVVAVEPLG